MSWHPIIKYLEDNGYEPLPRIGFHEKPKYKKGANVIEVCVPCGYVIINGNMIRFFKVGIPETLKAIPIQ